MLRFIFCLFIECFMIFRAVLSHRCFAFCFVLKWIFDEMLSYEKGKQDERRRVERKTNLNLQQREKKVLWKELLFNLFYENLIFSRLFLLGSRVEDWKKERNIYKKLCGRKSGTWTTWWKKWTWNYRYWQVCTRFSCFSAIFPPVNEWKVECTLKGGNIDEVTFLWDEIDRSTRAGYSCTCFSALMEEIEHANLLKL